MEDMRPILVVFIGQYYANLDKDGNHAFHGQNRIKVQYTPIPPRNFQVGLVYIIWNNGQGYGSPI